MAARADLQFERFGRRRAFLVFVGVLSVFPLLMLVVRLRCGGFDPIASVDGYIVGGIFESFAEQPDELFLQIGETENGSKDWSVVRCGSFALLTRCATQSRVAFAFDCFLYPKPRHCTGRADAPLQSGPLHTRASETLTRNIRRAATHSKCIFRSVTKGVLPSASWLSASTSISSTTFGFFDSHPNMVTASRA